MRKADLPTRILCLSLSHKRNKVKDLEKYRFDEPPSSFYSSIPFTGGEWLLLQTCNRIEVYAAVTDLDGQTVQAKDLILGRVPSLEGKERGARVDVYVDDAAVEHLLRVSSGLESMIIGEPQILGQVRGALARSVEHGSAGTYLRTLFEHGVRTGKRVRAGTRIGEGAASIGSVTGEMAEKELGPLRGKRVMILGAGEAAALVARALVQHGSNLIVVANRTHRAALQLAKEVGGEALRYEEVPRVLPEADLLVCATNAPCCIVRPKMFEELERGGRPLLIIDISNPRNVDPEVAALPGIRLVDIDGLRGLARRNEIRRAREVTMAELIVREEVEVVKEELRVLSIEPLIKALRSKAEEVRRSEAERALRMIGNVDGHVRGVIEGLSVAIINKLLHTPTSKLRRACLLRDQRYIEAVCDSLGIGREAIGYGGGPIHGGDHEGVKAHRPQEGRAPYLLRSALGEPPRASFGDEGEEGG